MPNESFKQANRSHTSILAAAEKRFLIWTASRLPLWVNSDHLTSLGFVALVAAGLCYYLASSSPQFLIWVIPCLFLNWFGDSLDGTLARVRNQQRPRYGFYVDHILDAIGTFFLISGLAFSSYMSPAVGTFHLSYWSFGPTELRILLIIGNLAALRRPMVHIAGRELLLFDVGFVIGTIAVTMILLQATIKHTIQLYKEETKS